MPLSPLWNNGIFVSAYELKHEISARTDGDIGRVRMKKWYPARNFFFILL